MAPDGRGGKEKLGRLERGERVARIYYVRKYMFSIKGGKLRRNKKGSLSGETEARGTTAEEW